jgi:hypothetical protein
MPTTPIPAYISQDQFTSTLNERQCRSKFNVWIAILTAIIFFLIWAIYTFLQSVYDFIIGANSTCVRNYEELNYFNVIASFGYMLLWIIITIVTYIILDSKQLLFEN